MGAVRSLRCNKLKEMAARTRKFPLKIQRRTNLGVREIRNATDLADRHGVAGGWGPANPIRVRCPFRYGAFCTKSRHCDISPLGEEIPPFASTDRGRGIRPPLKPAYHLRTPESRRFPNLPSARALLLLALANGVPLYEITDVGCFRAVIRRNSAYRK